MINHRFEKGPFFEPVSVRVRLMVRLSVHAEDQNTPVGILQLYAQYLLVVHVPEVPTTGTRSRSS